MLAVGDQRTRHGPPMLIACIVCAGGNMEAHTHNLMMGDGNPKYMANISRNLSGKHAWTSEGHAVRKPVDSW
eukprot:4476415-Prymnesium_polylepis.1